MKKLFIEGVTFLLFLTVSLVSQAKKIELLSPEGV